MREAYACARAVVRVVHKALMAHVPAFLYLFCTHVPAHAVLFAPEAAALHVRSASHAYSEQVGLGRQRLRRRRGACPLPSPAVARVCCVLLPFVSSPAQAKDGNSARTTAASRLRRTQLEAEGHGLSIAQHLCLLGGGDEVGGARKQRERAHRHGEGGVGFDPASCPRSGQGIAQRDNGDGPPWRNYLLSAQLHLKKTLAQSWSEQWRGAELETCVRSRWRLHARRDQTGWQAHHVLHSRRPQECSARRTAELPRNRAAPLRACCTTLRCVGGWSTCVSKGVDGESTMRRSRWSTFPGQRSPRSAIWTRTRANRWFRACRSPGFGFRTVTVTATRFASSSRVHVSLKHTTLYS